MLLNADGVWVAKSRLSVCYIFVFFSCRVWHDWNQKLISLCSFACQTHYKVIFKTQAQIASCMKLDRCTLKTLSMQSTQKIWPVSSTFIIACHVRQLFRNHFPMLRVYKYKIWKICFFWRWQQLYQTFFIRHHDECGLWGHLYTPQTMCTRNLSGNHRL